MFDVSEGNTQYRGETSIADIMIDGDLKICIFQGTRGQRPECDFRLKYFHRTPTGQYNLVQPSHTDWVVDVMMKRQGNKNLTEKFLKEILSIYNESTYLESNNYFVLGEILTLHSSSFKLNEFSVLNKFGEYEIQFLFIMLCLFAYEEKTSSDSAYFFKKCLENLLNDDVDLHTNISKSQPTH